MALLFKGRILYEDKKDYAAAIASWEQFLRVMPQGGPAEVVRGWIEEARREARKLGGMANRPTHPESQQIGRSLGHMREIEE